MKAWLITWEGTDRRIKEENSIAAIISAKRSSSFIEELCDVLFHRTSFDAADMVYYANHKKTDMLVTGPVGMV